MKTHNVQEDHDYSPAKANELLLPLEHVFKAGREVDTDLESRVPSYRAASFQQVRANTQYFHLSIGEEIEKLQDAGHKTLVDGMDQEQILMALDDREQWMAEWDSKDIHRHMLGSVDNQWDYATSPLFLVLPTNVESWDDSDPSTHQFSLYFMCHVEKRQGAKEGLPQHIHLSNHLGYRLSRPHEFLQEYGDYMLQVLRMVKHGYTDAAYEVPPLDSAKVLWICDPHVVGNQLSEQALGSLVDAAIAYLQKLSLSMWRVDPQLTCNQSAAIKAYLSIQNDGTGGNLHRSFINPERAVWMCREHTVNFTSSSPWTNCEKLFALTEETLTYNRRHSVSSWVPRLRQTDSGFFSSTRASRSIYPSS